METPSRPAKSSDVATLAGVSRATVSHILNGQGERFPEETRERVRAAATQLEYRPSPAGRNLVRGRSDTIIVLVPNSTWGSNLQNAVDQVATDTQSLGANVVVRFASGDPTLTVEALLSMKPLAVVDLGFLSFTDRARVTNAGIVTVPRFPDLGALDDLVISIAELQVASLAASGAEKIWFAALADDRLDAYGPSRLKSLERSCQARGLPAPQTIRIPLDAEAAAEALSAMSFDRKVGFACFNDDVAIAVLAGAQRLGISVPGTVAVVGMDHTPVGQLWSPRLTTIEFDIRGYMDGAVDELRATLSSEPYEPKSVATQLVTLIPGESS